MVRRKTNYLNNKDLLIQIHKSKCTFCEFKDDSYADFDYIIYDLKMLTDNKPVKKHFKELNPELTTYRKFLTFVKQKKLTKMKKADPTLELELSDILTGDLVFRYMTFEHIPEDPNWLEEKIKKKKSDGHMKVNFPPFQHYIFENGVPICVGQSHYKNQEFNVIGGHVSPTLGKMYMLLVEKISKKGNWRNYTYNDEMRSAALVQLSQVGLQFDEGRGLIPNPFAFYTTIINNSFKRVLNTEKRNRDIRDDLIEMAGQNPSMTRQLSELFNNDSGSS